jgi:hypothetical protein
MTLSDTDLEALLRRDLRAQGDAVPPAPPDLAETTRRRHRTLRRRELGWGAAAVAAALVLVGVPVVASTFAADPGRGQSAGPSSGVVTTMPNLADLPTRGSLADQDEWLTGLLALDWVGQAQTDYPGMEEIDPLVDTRHVSYAQDVPGGRVALVLGRWDDGWVHAWFLGPENAAPDQMELAAPPADTVVGEPQALLDRADGASDGLRLIVVAYPGDTAEILVRRDVDPSGEEVETWQDLALEDGTAVSSLIGPPLDQIAAGGIWVHHGEERSQQIHPMPTWGAMAMRLPTVEVADPRGLMTATSDELVQQAAQCLLRYFGGPPDDLGLTLLAGGPLGGSSMNQAALVGATFGSGAETACLATQTTSIDPGSVTGTMIRIDALPADDVPLVDEVLAVPMSDTIAVSGPRAGRTAEIYLSNGTLVATVPLADGAGLGPPAPPVGETVRILDASGSVIAEGPLLQGGG